MSKADTNRLKAFLEQANWFGALSQDHQKLARDTARIDEVPAGQSLINTGASCTHWYGLMAGVLQMYVVTAEGTDTTLLCLQEGEWGGDGSLLRNEPMRYELRALIDSSVCLIPKTVFDRLRRESFTFNQCLCDIMNERMGAFVGMLAATRLLGPDTRVARALLMVAPQQQGKTATLKVNQQELALIAGLSRQRVNQAIGTFRRQGIILSNAKAPCLTIDTECLQAYLAAGS